MQNLSKEHILDRIQSRIDELGMTANAAAVKAGLERTYLSQQRRFAERWPRVDNLQAICDVLGLRMAWVVTGLGRRLVDEPDFAADIAVVPVISWVAASNFSEAIPIDYSSEAPHLLAANLGRGDFLALQVRGDSMDRIAPDGAHIIVDRTDKILVSRAFYVFSRAAHEEATFKRWMTNPDRLEPFSTNLTHEAIFMTNPPHVIGRVRRVILEL